MAAAARLKPSHWSTQRCNNISRIAPRLSLSLPAVAQSSDSPFSFTGSVARWEFGLNFWVVRNKAKDSVHSVFAKNSTDFLGFGGHMFQSVSTSSSRLFCLFFFYILQGSTKRIFFSSRLVESVKSVFFVCLFVFYYCSHQKIRSVLFFKNNFYVAQKYVETIFLFINKILVHLLLLFSVFALFWIFLQPICLSIYITVQYYIAIVPI